MKEQGYQYTTDLLVIGCGFSGMWAAMRARDFLGRRAGRGQGPPRLGRGWANFRRGHRSRQSDPDMKLDDLLDNLVYYYDRPYSADQKLLGQILAQSYDRFMDFENTGARNSSADG